MSPETKDNDSSPLLYICRDIEGDHCGGPDCFCNPYLISADDDAAIARIMDLAEHPKRQVS